MEVVPEPSTDSWSVGNTRGIDLVCVGIGCRASAVVDDYMARGSVSRGNKSREGEELHSERRRGVKRSRDKEYKLRRVEIQQPLMTFWSCEQGMLYSSVECVLVCSNCIDVGHELMLFR